MDFTLRKPIHVIPALFLMISFFILLGLPVISAFWSAATTIPDIPDQMQLFVELFTVGIQTVIFVVFMILVPFMWYIIVNDISVKQALQRMKLRKKNLDKAVVFGILTVFIMFIVTMAIGMMLLALDYDLSQISDMGNIKDIAQLFSPVSMIYLLAFQPIGEEIFFRGFLLEKIESVAVEKKWFQKPSYAGYTAILITSVLFGIAHFSYGKLYPVVVTFLLAIVLGFVVYKTRNLFTSIIAHIAYNLISLLLYLTMGEIF